MDIDIELVLNNLEQSYASRIAVLERELAMQRAYNQKLQEKLQEQDDTALETSETST